MYSNTSSYPNAVKDSFYQPPRPSPTIKRKTKKINTFQYLRKSVSSPEQPYAH